MILLHSDCLVFETSSGQKIPCSAELVTLELMGDSAQLLDPELVHHAAESVLHYFKYEIRQVTVSVGEFTEALAKVLRGLGIKVTIPDEEDGVVSRISGADLCEVMDQCGEMLELSLYPRLREEVRRGLLETPDVLRFTGLKSCVKRLAGAKRWCPRCDRMRDRVVGYLHRCWLNDEHASTAALVVD